MRSEIQEYQFEVKLLKAQYNIKISRLDQCLQQITNKLQQTSQNFQKDLLFITIQRTCLISLTYSYKDIYKRYVKDFVLTLEDAKNINSKQQQILFKLNMVFDKLNQFQKQSFKRMFQQSKKDRVKIPALFLNKADSNEKIKSIQK